MGSGDVRAHVWLSLVHYLYICHQIWIFPFFPFFPEHWAIEQAHEPSYSSPVSGILVLRTVLLSRYILYQCKPQNSPISSWFTSNSWSHTTVYICINIYCDSGAHYEGFELATCSKIELSVFVSLFRLFNHLSPWPLISLSPPLWFLSMMTTC